MSTTTTVSPAQNIFERVQACAGKIPRRIRTKLSGRADFLPQMGDLDQLLNEHGFEYENIQFHEGYLVLVGARRG